MLIGNKISLRAVERTDLKLLCEWRNRPHYRKYFREYREINIEMQENWFDKFVVNDRNTIMFSIIDNATSQLIGCCGLCYINWIQRNADLSLYIGYNDEYIDSKGYAEEACKLLFSYAFEELSLNKIWTEIYEFDHKKLKLYDKIGLKQDGLLRENYFYEGEWINSRVMSILQKDFQILKKVKA